jgi:hypothetical protein
MSRSISKKAAASSVAGRMIKTQEMAFIRSDCRTLCVRRAGHPSQDKQKGAIPRRLHAIVSRLLHAGSVPRGGPVWATTAIPGSSWGTASASRTEAGLLVSIQAPSFTRNRRNASPVMISPSPSNRTGRPFRLKGCSVVNVRGILLPESGCRSGSAGKTSMAVARVMATAANEQHQRREPAATDAGIVTELNGWLPSAECWGSVISTCQPPRVCLRHHGAIEAWAGRVCERFNESRAPVCKHKVSQRGPVREIC